MSRKAVSELIATIIVIALVIFIGALISPWATKLAKNVTNESATSALSNIRCQYAALDFDTSYATNGVSSNFTGANPILRVKVVNKGTVDMHTFSFETEFNSSVIKRFDPVAADQKSVADPLKPGQAAILNASISPAITGTLNNIRIIPQPCPEVAVKQTT